MSRSFAKISDLIPREELYTKRINVQVVDISHHGWTTSECIKFVVADETGYQRVSLYSKKHVKKITLNGFVLMNNFSVTEYGIVMRDNSIIMHSKSFEIEKSVIERAQLVLVTPVKELVTCSDLKKSPIKSILTIKGVVISEDETRQITVRNKPCTVKEIKLRDATDTIRCSLWRSATDSPLRIGQTVTLMDSNVTYNTYHKCNILNINDIQAIVIEQEFTGVQDILIIAIDDLEEEIVEIYCDVNDEEKVLQIAKGLFFRTFGFDEFSEVTDIIEKLPIKCSVKIDGKVIKDVEVEMAHS